jgi:heme/copper-type cytochrome/quinol oxidase subunit 2
MCSLCKEALSSVAGLAQAFSWSVVVMLAVPLLVVVTVIVVLVRAQRRSSSVPKPHLPPGI